MDINQVNCDEDHETALREIERLADADPDSPEGRQRDMLLKLVAQYEAKGRPEYNQPV